MQKVFYLVSQTDPQLKATSNERTTGSSLTKSLRLNNFRLKLSFKFNSFSVCFAV